MLKKGIAIILATFMIIQFCQLSVFADNPNSAYEIYVSVDGNDNAQGTKTQPFATMERAAEEVRKINKTIDRDIIINVGEGTYFLDKTFELSEADSGFNGHRVIWRGDNMKTVVSGGRKVEGFTKHDGDIYKVVLPEYFGDQKVGGLYVNGKSAVMAHNEEIYRSTNITYHPDTKFPGLVISNADLSNMVKPNESFLVYRWSWRRTSSPIYDIGEDESGNSVVYFNGTKFIDKGGLHETGTGVYAFHIYNEYSLMTEENEFYYDSSERTMYYKKPADLDIENAEIIVPYLPVVMKLQGENAFNKAKNISFEGFTFAHADELTLRDGVYIHTQTTHRLVYDSKSEYNGINRSLESASVWVNNAEDIQIKGNMFTQSECVGLGVYEGVSNSIIDGNVFYDLASSGFNMGTPGQRDIQDTMLGMTNVAYNKKVTASNDLSGSEGAFAITDEYLRSGTVISSTADEYTPWLTIDLGDHYTVNMVEIDYESNLGEFEIWGSSTPDFLEYDVLNKCDGKYNKITKQNNQRWTANVFLNRKYRYVRYVQTDRKSMKMYNVRVFTKDLNGMPSSEICSNNVVSNNVFNYVARFQQSAASMSVYYVTDTEILHNEIYNSPYTAISFGYGWALSTFHMNERRTAKNNKVNYNFISGAMLDGCDGGGIYSLGTQQNEEIKGNYVRDILTGAGIYPDNGSADISITQNVLENTVEAFTPWSSDSVNIRVFDNYSSTPRNNLGALDSYIVDNKLFIRGNMPKEAKAIADYAGLEEGYWHLRDYADVVRVEEYQQNMDYSMEKLHMSYLGYGETRNFTNIMLEAKFILDTAIVNGLVTEDSSDEFNKLKDAIKYFEKNQYMPEYAAEEKTFLFLCEQQELIIPYLKKLMDSFVNSGAFTSDNYNIKVQSVGDEQKVINMENLAKQAKLYDESEFLAGEILFNQKYITDPDETLSYGEDGLLFKGDKHGAYLKYKFDDTLIKASVSIPNHNLYGGFILRSQGPSNYLSTSDCYIIIIKNDAIELQRNSGGKRVFIRDDIPLGSFKMNSVNDVTLQTINEENGVRIIMKANGNVVFDELDDNEAAIRNPGFFGMMGMGIVTLHRAGDEILFEDITDISWAKKSIEELYANSIINGKTETLYAPYDTVTRAELVTMLCRALKKEYNGEISDFSDIDESDWYYESVAIAEKDGLLDKMYTSEFNGNAAITRKEVIKLVARVLNTSCGYYLSNIEGATSTFKDTSHLSDDYMSSIDLCCALEIIKGDENGCFLPDDLINRAEVAVVIDRLNSYLY